MKNPMNLIEIPGRVETLGIAEFRRSLKAYLSRIKDTYGTVYQLGSDKAILVMSPATLERLQNRHFINTWIRGRYRSLKLDQYPTLAQGIQTKELPLDLLLALVKLFELIGKTCDILARPGANQNAMKWDISEYLMLAAEGKPLTKWGKFDTVYGIVTQMFEPETFELFLQKPTLHDFFQCLEELSQQDQNIRRGGPSDGKATMKLDEVKEYQRSIVYDAIHCVTRIMTDLMEYQIPQENETRQIEEKLLLQFQPVADWYEDCVGPLPKTFLYDPVYRI